jgi:hypothetical protein
MEKNQTSHKTLQHHLLHQRYASKASFSLGYILGGLSSASKNSLESSELKEIVLFEIEFKRGTGYFNANIAIPSL